MMCPGTRPYLHSHFEVGTWFDILNFARNLTPGLLMILCFTLFTEKRPLPGWLLEEPAHALVSPGWRFAALLTQAVPSILQMSFALVSIYWATSSWRADLVETRMPEGETALDHGSHSMKCRSGVDSTTMKPSRSYNSRAGLTANTRNRIGRFDTLASTKRRLSNSAPNPRR
jgi:hypothetical protein